MWLEVASTNNDPLVISDYYLRCIEVFHINFLNYIVRPYFYLGLPRVLRADQGTENTTVAALQPFLRHKDTDDMGGERSLMYERSTANQVMKSKLFH